MSTGDFYARLQETRNVLLMRDEVGKAKPSMHVLPSDNFVYGKVEAKDKEGVYALTHHWQEHQPTPTVETEKDFRKLNILSVEKKLVRPNQVSEFRKSADVRLKKAKGAPQKQSRQIPDLRHGVPSQPSDSMRDVIGNEFGNAAEAEMVQIYQQLGREKASKAQHRTTSVPASSKKSVSAPEPVPLFKLKKFTGVGPKINSRRD